MSTQNPATIVATGYDAMADQYLSWKRWSEVRKHFLDLLIARLGPNSAVLDLGCGAGVPAAATLVNRGHSVTGVDISERQIELAKGNVPDAQFLLGDMTKVALSAASFDAAIALYSVIHVPREEHGALFARIAEWLRPGGLFLVSLGSSNNSGGVENDWLGVPMFFSHFDGRTSLALLSDAGFHPLVVERRVEPADDGAIFQWVLAQKREGRQ